MADESKSADAARRSSADILREIEQKLATVDGISTSDAFALGGLVREYGQSCAGDTSKMLFETILGGIRKPIDEPWRKDGR